MTERKTTAKGTTNPDVEAATGAANESSVQRGVAEAFAAAQEAMTRGASLFGSAFAAPEGVRMPGLDMWQRVATGSAEGIETWSRELLQAQRQGAEHAQHLIDESARLSKATLTWQLELIEKTTRQSLDLARQSARMWQGDLA